jgi:hypothetical protein
MHRYIWARLVRDAAWPAPWGSALTIAVFVLAVLVPVAFLAMRGLPRAVNAPLSWVAYIWMGFALYLFRIRCTTPVWLARPDGRMIAG